MKWADRKKEWAIKTRVDKLSDQITFRSNVVYLSIHFLSTFVCDMCIKDWVYRNFFFVLCLHFWYYIIWKSCNVSPRFVRISVFSHSFDVSYKSFHIKKIFRLYVMRNHTIFLYAKELVTIYWYLAKNYSYRLRFNHVTQQKNFVLKFLFLITIQYRTRRTVNIIWEYYRM